VRLTWISKPDSDTHSHNMLTAGVQGGPQWTLARVFAPTGTLRIEWKIETLQLVDGVMTLSPVNASPKTYAEATELAEKLALDRLALLGFQFTEEAHRSVKSTSAV